MNRTAQPPTRRRVIRTAIARIAVTILSLSVLIPVAKAQKPYSDEVVAKAEGVLKDVDLRRSGKVIQMTGNSRIARALTSLSKDKRDLRRAREEWEATVKQLTVVREEIERLNVRFGELNLRLARMAADPTANNQMIALINATSSQIKTLATQREKIKETVAEKRAVVNKVEVMYADTVLAIRQDYAATKEHLDEVLNDDQVKIALQVMNRNFETPQNLTADQILAALNKRIERIESEVFQETIPLESRGGSLYVDVVVGNKTTQMVVDSGATMISLPLRAAAKLGIEVPAEARELKMVLADGRSIPARAITLPRVRVGRFEVENVDAAVLDIAEDAEPLLGMSFLGNFKFVLDAGEKELKLLSIKD